MKCIDKARTFIDLVKGAGMLAREGDRLYYMEADDEFSFHAWAYCKPKESWTPADPTFGRIRTMETRKYFDFDTTLCMEPICKVKVEVLYKGKSFLLTNY